MDKLKLGPLFRLDDFLTSKNLYTVFQPVISLKDASVFGYECFVRFDAGEGFEDNSFFSPENIFAQKKAEKDVWGLDKLCFKSAVKTARALGLRKKLFINLCAASLFDRDFQKDYFVKAFQKYGIDCRNVIIEFSERNFSEELDFQIKECSDFFKEAGLSVAVDNMRDFGMKNVYSLNPEFVKLDRLAVKNIQNDSLKFSMAKNFVDFCRSIGTKTVAVGVEDEDELKALLELGVDFAQGFFIGKGEKVFEKAGKKSFATVASFRYSENVEGEQKSKKPGGVDAKKNAGKAGKAGGSGSEEQDVSLEKEGVKKNSALSPFLKDCRTKIGDFCVEGITFFAETPVPEVLELFQSNVNCLLAVVVDGENRVLGTITRSKFLGLFSSRYGFNLYSRKTIGSLMKKDFLFADENESLIKVSQEAMERDSENIYSPVVVLSKGKYRGIVTVKNLLDTLVNVEVAEKTKDLMLKNKILLKQQQVQARDMKMAELVQKSFYKSAAPQSKDWEAAFFFKPMSSVSGDVYDFYADRNGGFSGCSLFDVSGHGVASGLVGILSKYLASQIFRMYSDKKLNAMLKAFNRSLTEAKGMVENYLTGVFLRVCGSALEYVNAGQPDVFIKRPGKKTAALGEDKKGFRGTFIGIEGLPEEWKTVEEKLEKGTYLLLYTDCLVESRNLMGFEMDGRILGKVFDRACQKNGNSEGKTAKKVLEDLMDAFESFTEGVPWKDDLTVIVLRYKGL